MSNLTDIQRMIDNGNKTEARAALISILQHDPKNVEAWLLLGSIIEDPQKKRDCYNQVRKISPDNFEAAFQLSRLDAALPKKPKPIVEKSVEDLEKQRKKDEREYWGKAIPIILGVIFLIYIVFFSNVQGSQKSCDQYLYLYNRALENGKYESALYFMQDYQDHCTK